jgi:flagellar biosynthesis protein FlhG
MYYAGPHNAPFPAPVRLLAADTPPASGPSSAAGAEVIPIRGEAQAPSRVIAITSGKGGVGKSVLSANLGICMARLGRRVLMVDADLALANLDLMLGVNARATINDILSNRMRIEDVIVEGPHGVHLIPACSGDSSMAEMDEKLRLALFSAIDSLEDRYDTVLVDTGAGIGSNSTAFAAAAQQTVVVVTPDPASMADAYAMIKVLCVRCGLKRIHLVVNQASGPAEADMVVERLLGLVSQFLDVSVVPVGYVYHDEAVEQSVRRCKPLVSVFPQAPVTASLQALAGRLLEEDPLESSWGGPRLFWKKLMGIPDKGENDE